MRPLPTTTQAASVAVKPAPVIAANSTLELGPLHHSSSPAPNRRAQPCPISRAYPVLLVASTALAAVFCALYIQKPVIVAGQPPGPAATATAPAPATFASSAPAGEALLPHSAHLPGDTAKPQPADPRRLASRSDKPFEETNLRVQHVLKAQGPRGEDLGKIMLEVPVLYRSRALRWTPAEIARARDLMTRIGNYQEASRMVREEGQKLLGEWNLLIGESIPAEVLRADSPSLSTDPSPAAATESLDSTQAIEIQNR